MANAIYGKMVSVMREIGAVTKDKTNGSQGFKFRGIDQFLNTLYPALCKHGVFLSPECVSEAHELKDVTRSNGKSGIDKHVSILMKYHFFADDGSSVTIGPMPAEGLDSGDKATNKALSAALKYGLMQAFSVPTEDMEDADSESPEIAASANMSAAPASVDPANSSPAAPSSAAPSPTKGSSWRKAKPSTASSPAASTANASLEF